MLTLSACGDAETPTGTVPSRGRSYQRLCEATCDGALDPPSAGCAGRITVTEGQATEVRVTVDPTRGRCEVDAG